MRPRLTPLALCVVIGLSVAACSSNGTNSAVSPTTPPATEIATTTTVDPALATAYAPAGPFPVGVTTATMDNGVKVEIWYPAVAGSTGTETYDARDFTDPIIASLLTGDIPSTVSYPATRDAAVAEGKFPIVLNSHGVSAWRSASSFITSHLASWGMIVVSPDHASRDLYHLASNIPAAPSTTTPEASSTTQADTTTTLDPKVLARFDESVNDLLGSLDYITAQNSATASPFAGHVDLDHVGALGHSAGGGTILKAALDPRIDGYVSMASGILSNQAELPAKPSFFLSGAIDQIANTERTHQAFLTVPAPSLFWRIDGAGHNAFDDLCTLGGGIGIIGVAEASGLGAFLDSAPMVRTLGSDGCLPPAVPVTTTFPIIEHATTAWFLNLFGVDATPKGLDPSVAGSYDVKVTIEQR
ncbi:unannotated protein [freshwater metagenome]|uniref:Unannotated protein n=1 Tax=freshwater metagenome TaxID=449393 RepID=A0A6J7FXP8_9ZZZZ|nr:hypothetical protein [Actinomycetota bacterium]